MAKDTQKYHEGSSYYGKGYGKFANMPEAVEQNTYPNPYGSLDNDAYPDTMPEIDADFRYNDKKVRSRRSKTMY